MIQGLQVGATLQNNKYKIERVLGQGSFGITYLATAKFTTQGNLGKMNVEAKVAIKEFFMSEVNSRKGDCNTIEGSSGNIFTNYRKKFKKEAENLSKLEHPNIVKVFDVFDENNTTYYVMEFLEGKDLDEYIQQRGSIPEQEAIKIISDIGNALAYMHSRKMLHLDIKPRNIMRSNSGANYLIDFGLSKQFSEGGEPESSTSVGMGTPGYAPVEQAAYKQDGSFPATLDVYALGGTLFKMLTGKRPPEATYILNEGFPSSELRSVYVSRSTQAVLENAMAPIKKNRYPDVKTFLANLGVDESTVITPKAVQNASQADLATQYEAPSRPSTQNPINNNRESADANNNLPPTGTSDNEVPTRIVDALENESSPVDISKYESNKKSINWLYYVIGFVLAIVAFLILVYPTLGSDASADSGTNVDAETPALQTLEIENSVKDIAWESPLGNAVYNGMVDPKSAVIDSLGNTVYTPHGIGRATIKSGEYAGYEYRGNFVHGKMEGQCTYILSNGDKFEGFFKDNEYDYGKYTVKSGEYFEGRFKNGQPDTSRGSWYHKNGKRM